MARVRRRILVALLALALVALAVVRPSVVLPPVGRFLVEADPLGRADAIVVLAGERLAERGFAARDLYLAGRAPHVLLTQEEPPWLAAEVARLNIRVVWPHDVDRQILATAGVPDTAVELLPPTDNTLGDARAVARLMRERRWSSVIVVTSRYQSRRACWTFRRVMRETARVDCHPSPYDRFEADRWWRDDRMALSLANEYLKLAATFLPYGAEAAVQALTGRPLSQ